jgi:hypothetical protein
MKKVKKLSVGVTLFLFGIFMILIVPLGVIWSFNNLFELGIEYNWKTWLSVVILNMYFFIPKKNK